MDGGTQDVRKDGSGTVTTMNSGGQSIQNGGNGTITTMNGGTQAIAGGPSGGSGTIAAMIGGTQSIGSGAIGIIISGLNSGCTQKVNGGGTAKGTVDNGGILELAHNGAVLQDSNGTQINRNAYVLHGGTLRLRGGASITDYTVSNGTLELERNGWATSTTIHSGGVQIVQSGGSATDTTDAGGVLELHSGAHLNGGTDYSNYALSGGTMRLTDGAAVDGYTVSNGTLELASGGTATSTTVNEGGVQNVLSGGTADGETTIKNGGVQTAEAGGVLAGTQTIEAGGSASGGTLTGTQIVHSGGKTSGATIASTGVVEIHSGAIINGGTNYNDYTAYQQNGGTLRLTEGAEVSGQTVSKGTMEIASGGTATNITVSGGTQTVGADAVVDGTVLEKGAQNILPGATVSNTTINEGVAQNVASGGTAKDTTINGGTQNVENGGVASGGTLKSGTQNVASGGTAKGATIEGGTQNIASGATVTGMTVSGGTQNIEQGAAVSDVTVKGGTQTVENGGFASGGALSDGALQIVEAGGTAQGLTLNNGGTQNVYGMARGATVNSGGTQHIFSGGSAAGTMLSGGTITVDDYATAQIDTAAGGMVELLDAGLATAIFGNGATAGSYAVDALYARGDTVILGQGDANPSPVGNKLNVSTMDGYASFVVNTDLANNQSDQIEIGTATNATEANTIKINYDPTLAKKQTVTTTNTKVATVKSGTATFEGAKSTIGGVDYLPTVETKDGGKSWYITGVNKGAGEGTHHVLMGMTAGMAALSAGTAYINDATDGLGLMANTGKDGVSTFAKFGGGSIRQETGSHVDVKTWNAILALGHANKKERGTFEYGAFFEYGSGNYATHDNDLRGDGSMDYTGGGVLAKWTAAHGFYVEGSFRAGTVHDDAKNVLHDDVNTYSYDTNANYFGAHIGVGKEIEVANGNTVDVYGKFFFNRRNGVSFDAGPNRYDLDAVKSEILRVGARYTMKREKWNFYGGVAYEHEFGGEATGTVDGLAIRSADIKGGSARFELGATMKPDKNGTWSLDLNVAGFAGKKQGFTGGVSVAFMF